MNVKGCSLTKAHTLSINFTMY